MNKTIITFKEEISGFQKLKDEFLNNLVNKKELEFVLDLFDVYFDFNREKVTICYYVKDGKYPDVELSFDEFKKIVEES